MFGFSVHVLQEPSRLTVVSPFGFGMLLAIGVFTLWPLVIFFSERPLKKRRVAVLAIVTLLIFGYLPSSSRLVLDRTKGTATIRRYFLYHWSTETVPLGQIDNASVHTGSTTSQIQIQYTDGSVHELSELNQMGGKDEAVYAINHFLGRQ